MVRTRFAFKSLANLGQAMRSLTLAARKDGPRTLVDVASLKAHCAALPLKPDHAPIVFGHRAHVLARSHRHARRRLNPGLLST